MGNFVVVQNIEPGTSVKERIPSGRSAIFARRNEASTPTAEGVVLQPPGRGRAFLSSLAAKRFILMLYNITLYLFLSLDIIIFM